MPGSTLLVIALDLLRTALMLLVGYLVGTLPISTWIGRAAGVDVTRVGGAGPGSATVWGLAGPGRNAHRAAIAAWFGTSPVLFLLELRDLARLAGTGSSTLSRSPGTPLRGDESLRLAEPSTPRLTGRAGDGTHHDWAAPTGVIYGRCSPVRCGGGSPDKGHSPALDPIGPTLSGLEAPR